jgi:hypothetical protein
MHALQLTAWLFVMLSLSSPASTCASSADEAMWGFTNN